MAPYVKMPQAGSEDAVHHNVVRTAPPRVHGRRVGREAERKALRVRPIPGYPLWLGHVGDVRDLRAVLAAGIVAVVDLALNEPPAAVTRELVYCRFPLVDGAGNPPWLLRSAVETLAGLVRSGTPTLVFCGAGMSRTPAVAAAALSRACGVSPAEALVLIAQAGAADVSPGLWRDLQALFA
jgi:hypothetical protein